MTPPLFPRLSALTIATGLALSSWLNPGIVAAAPAESPGQQLSVVLVHGAWADGSCWNDVIPLLQQKGLTVVAVQNPLSSLADDVAATQRAIDRQPGKVLLVGHSWGGVVVTEVGRQEKVAGLVYVAAFAPADGESVNDLSSNKDLPQPPGLAGIEPDAHGYLWMSARNFGEHFAQDLAVARTALMAVTQKPIAARSFGDKVSVPAWRSKPSWYVLAAQDHMIPPPAQKAMADRAQAKLTSLEAGHAVMMSKPAEVAAVIVAAAQSLRR
ncbi:MAG TPA: alpha/beta hydrolase [Ideonella sp.]|uniref:alpha/beta fold hydrolase n=1 Tax=Ideonella sp. TaxID=1929293 RepID=UPI002BA9772D|nr:alpha/beta hydrolase [Ideonella sp.]HSI49472.1 alpha/beta hydrolase [Ideonella sp.]